MPLNITAASSSFLASPAPEPQASSINIEAELSHISTATQSTQLTGEDFKFHDKPGWFTGDAPPHAEEVMKNTYQPAVDSAANLAHAVFNGTITNKSDIDKIQTAISQLSDFTSNAWQVGYESVGYTDAVNTMGGIDHKMGDISGIMLEQPATANDAQFDALMQQGSALKPKITQDLNRASSALKKNDLSELKSAYANLTKDRSTILQWDQKTTKAMGSDPARHAETLANFSDYKDLLSKYETHSKNRFDVYQQNLYSEDVKTSSKALATRIAAKTPEIQAVQTALINARAKLASTPTTDPMGLDDSNIAEMRDVVARMEAQLDSVVSAAGIQSSDYYK